MSKVKYVFWDSDNTLVDTARHHWNKHLETLKWHDIVLSEDYRYKIYSNNGEQNWEWITEELGLDVPLEKYLDQIDQWYFDNIDAINMRPGINAAIKIFEEAQIPQAVVSNGRRRSVMAALDAKNITPKMKFILCKEDYAGRKPEPAPYLAALKKIEEVEGASIDPKTCLVIEDDPKGVESGKAAKMQVIDRPPGEDDPDAFIETIKSFLA